LVGRWWVTHLVASLTMKTLKSAVPLKYARSM
jgi:hypothetical protein